MNYVLKRPKSIPMAVLLLLILPVSLKFNFVGTFLETFILGSVIMLILFGRNGYRQLFQKMKAPWWLPFYVGVMLFLVEGCLIKILTVALGDPELFHHGIGHDVKAIPNVWLRALDAFIFLFSAVNEELLMIPILLVLFILLKRKKWGWYVASFMSGVIFALLHFTVYSMHPAVITLLVVNRMFLNENFKWCQSIRGPMITHFLIDGTGLFFIFS
ncbi:CPBP family intramembrane metalloprotease [Fructobacillus sp. M2-14]|uniref:CPBP family intramembrane metalloprotease n=1 Tax=Fructobacillus broussonetiae TaxID=2713173 RepID=A0ABS5QZ96_9LACO|nr:CPBP family glutamic-type intramembrane protease [Fructobacillus broussonetiae]MBS9338518.1 CPBP family intramembrane metalloprotease [Fructobacillus broussonetiae]